ncbi:piggyBac transposable element-derived protein 4-like [Hyla sarda]|uniref:piggyBac transposable element-derived protein 4-like n=1 Tax=Hyla sarda TaxID=327740 RepID=UPI0024C22172|nr:piggyBac transposable element-derived protein 4-like [Hyla sarda]
MAGFTDLDFLKFFLSVSLVNHMVEQTNLYAQQFIAHHPDSFLARSNEWRAIEAAEMRTFWGLTLHMGLDKNKVLVITGAGTSSFRSRFTITLKRFEAIRKCLHYADNAACPPRGDPAYDRLCKKILEAYVPLRDLSVDESLISFKGRLIFSQYIPSKRVQYCVKLYKLCESTSGYTCRFRVYEGRDSRIEPPDCSPTLGVSGKIVWDLMHPLLDKGYHVYVDNFYTSIPLFTSLAAISTSACGTVRKNQRGLPLNLRGAHVRQQVRDGHTHHIPRMMTQSIGFGAGIFFFSFGYALGHHSGNISCFIMFYNFLPHCTPYYGPLYPTCLPQLRPVVPHSVPLF